MYDPDDDEQGLFIDDRNAILNTDAETLLASRSFS
jgi:hypothetical protein